MTLARPAARTGRITLGRALVAGLVCLWAATVAAGGTPRHAPARAQPPSDEKPQPAQAEPKPPAARPEPYRGPGESPLDFRGAGREKAAPEVAEVVLGWFGPGDPDHPRFGDSWRGATLAVEQENAAGGLDGKPFVLASAWSESPWKAGVVDLAKLVYQRGAWAVVGGVDGTTTHLAVQLALKSHVLLLSPGSTDVTADNANVPWLFSLPPSDAAIAPLVADRLASARGRFAIVAGTDHDSHATLVAVRKALADRRLAPAALMELPQVDADLPAAVQQLLAARPLAVVVLATSTTSAQLVVELRRAGYEGLVIGGPTASLGAFGRAAGAAGDGTIAPAWLARGTPEWSRFAATYQQRWHSAPDLAAGHGFDAVRITTAAIRRAGLNRARIRDAVRALAPWRGAVGAIEWSPVGRNTAPVALAAWRGGVLQRPD